MRRRLLSIVLGLVLMFAACYPVNVPVPSEPATTPTPSLPSPPSPQPSTVNLPLSGRVVLAPLDEERGKHELEKMLEETQSTDTETAWQSIPRPLNIYGMFRSQIFYLIEDETLYLVLRSNLPIEIAHQFSGMKGPASENCLYASIWHVGVCFSGHWHKECQLRKSGNYWEATSLVQPGGSGFFELEILNFSDEPCWCDYTVTLYE